MASAALYPGWERAQRSNPSYNKIKFLEIAASLALLAITKPLEFFRNPLG